MGTLVNREITKSQVIGGIRKNLDISFAPNDAFFFLVDVINNASTLKSLLPMIKSVPAGNIETLSVGKRKIRLADDDSNENPVGVGSIKQDKIPYAVKKVFWDEWIKNDDVFYNAVRAAQRDLMAQQNITTTADLEKLVIQMIQKQFAMDLQDLAFNGDTAYPEAGPDSKFIKILDGFVKKMLASKHVTDIGEEMPTITDFVNHIILVPEEYKNNYNEDYVWLMARTTHDRLVSLVQARATGYGDIVLQEGVIKKLVGYNVEIVAGIQGPLKDNLDATKGRRGFVALTPRSNLVPVLTQDVKYQRTSDGALALKKDSTYHIIHAYLDCIVRDINAVAYMVGDKL